ncbi:fungal transcriptional regulatory protein [Scheffersomyces stipitis CBS 6054]|uniref:Fungal transcriptional regulatory protein n=1 Tax=Scheffersomyces stipitis (strain ATCC 58785 / CBS 6054 / NBRC 10063 / NRRL Y-11545) TaxID=322104 RepID=A3GIF1_PICST|nr:fungal transcriptional regulatory protein [Scheffersomyces stipitis CBS 6054]EAZ62980.2 fungal transcriptional regulatory protein [Scheffersomyces stipitis CBS 6054]
MNTSTERSFKRVKTGCLKCRKRHKKCDEVRPNCSSCTKKKEVCEWPVSYGKFHKNSTFQLPANKAVHKTATTKESKKYSEHLANNFNRMSHLEAEGNLSSEAETLLSMSVPRLNKSKSNASYDDTYSFSPESIMEPFLLYNELHNTLREYMFSNVSSTAEVSEKINGSDNIIFCPTTSNNIDKVGEQIEGDSSSSRANNKQVEDDLDATNEREPIPNKSNELFNVLIHEPPALTEMEKLFLYKNYLYEVAPWLDMFDYSQQFGITIPQQANSNAALMFAIYAVSSRQIELTNPDYDKDKTIKIYQESLKYLIPTVEQTMDRAIISSCVILCVLEMMSSSPKEWRHHLEGCSALFRTNNIHGFSDDLERGLFWCYARMDVSSAVIGEQSTVLPTEYWLPKEFKIKDSKEYFQKENKPDMYANYIVFLCSRVLNLISNETPNFRAEWESLFSEVVAWHVNRPPELQPFMEFEHFPFPGLLFLNGPAISSNQLYHMAIILLSQNKPRLLKVKPSRSVKSNIWHAKQICAISLHNTHHGCWNNALQPLWIAGKLLSSEEEHTIILNLLDKIESTTGWQMNFRARDLKRFWDGKLVE